MTSIARIVSLTVLATIMVFLGISFFHVVAPFLMPLFLAAVAAILCQPLFHHFTMRLKGRKRIAASLTTMTVLFAILLPIVVGISLATAELYTYAYITIKDDQWKENAAEFIHHKLPFKDLDEWITPLLEGEDSKTGQPVQEEGSVDETDSDDTKPDKESTKEESKDTESKDELKTTEAPVAVVEKVEKEVEKKEKEEDSTESDEVTESDPETASDSDEETAISDVEKKKKKETQYQEFVEHVVESMGEDIKATLVSIAQRSAGFAGAAISGFVGAFITSIVGLVMFIVALYYFLADGPAMIDATEKMIPLHVPYQKELIQRFEITVRSVVMATMLSAIAQGLATAFMLSIVVKTPFFILFMVATIASLIPMAGTWLVWGPYALGLIFQTEPQWGSAIVLIVVGGGIIGTMDNVIKTYILQNDIRLHPLLALVSVLGGIHAMGLWGVFIGPIVASCLYALVRIFNVELKELSEMQKEKKHKRKRKKQAAEKSELKKDSSVEKEPDEKKSEKPSSGKKSESAKDS